MSRKKRSLPVFYLVLILFVLLFFTVLFFALRALTGWLGDYESSLPKHLANEVFSQFYSPLQVGELLRKSGLSLSDYETAETAESVLREMTEGKETTWSGVTTGVDDIKKYVVKAGDTRISYFTLEKSGEKTKYGNDLYTLRDVTLLLSFDKSADILVPDGYRLFINGKAADESLITESGIETESCSHMPEGVKGVTYSRWHVEGLLKEPETEVFSPDGERCELTEDREAGCPRAGIVYDQKLENEMRDYVVKAAETYAAYMQMDESKWKVLPYFEKGTPLYDGVNTVEYYFVIDHNGYRFDDVFCGEFYAYDENTFSCRVSFVQVLTRRGEPDYRDYLDMTLYLRKVDGVYLIYDRMNNN